MLSTEVFTVTVEIKAPYLLRNMKPALGKEMGKLCQAIPLQSGSTQARGLAHRGYPVSACWVLLVQCVHSFSSSCPTPFRLLFAHCMVLFMRECFKEHTESYNNSALSE